MFSSSLKRSCSSSTFNLEHFLLAIFVAKFFAFYCIVQTHLPHFEGQDGDAVLGGAGLCGRLRPQNSTGRRVVGGWRAARRREPPAKGHSARGISAEDAHKLPHTCGVPCASSRSAAQTHARESQRGAAQRSGSPGWVRQAGRRWRSALWGRSAFEGRRSCCVAVEGVKVALRMAQGR
jgi:hypothetical protein